MSPRNASEGERLRAATPSRNLIPAPQTWGDPALLRVHQQAVSSGMPGGAAVQAYLRSTDRSCTTRGDPMCP